MAPKPKGLAKAFVVVGFVGLAIVALPVFNNYRRTAEGKALRSKYLRGELPSIPGPFLTVGDAHKLRFRVIDLGVSDRATLDEDGDVLYSPVASEMPRNGVVDVSHHVYRRRDGHSVDLGSDLEYWLTAGGRLISKPHMNQVPREIKVDGKVVFALKNSSDSEPGSPNFNLFFGDVVPTDDGFPSFSPTDRKYYFADLKWNIRHLDVDGSFSFDKAQASTQLGTITTISRDSLTKGTQSSILALHDGKLSEIAFPTPGEWGQIRACKDSIYVNTNGGNGPYQLVPWKLVKGVFERQAVLRDSYQCQVVAGSSVDRCLMFATYLTPKEQRPKPNPIPDSDFREYYVEGENAYDLKEIFRLNRVSERAVPGDHWEVDRMMSSRGDLLVSSQSMGIHHTLLFQRLP